MAHDLESDPEKQSVCVLEKGSYGNSDKIPQDRTVTEKEAANVLPLSSSKKETQIDPNYVPYGYLKGTLLVLSYFILNALVAGFYQDSFDDRRQMWRHIRELMKTNSEDKSILIGVIIEMSLKSKKAVTLAVCASVIYAHLTVIFAIFFRRVNRYHKQILKGGLNIYSCCATTASASLMFCSLDSAIKFACAIRGSLWDMRDASSELATLVGQSFA